MTVHVLSTADRRSVTRSPLLCPARRHEIDSYEDKVRAQSSLAPVVVPPLEEEQ